MPEDTSYFIPIVHNDSVVAVLAAASEPGEREEMLRKIEFLGPFFDLFAIALHHAHLYHNLQERERELRESKKMEIMGVLMAGIAHNFNNLLQGVIGNIDFALEAPEEAPELIERALRSSDSLAEMVRQLMSYSRKGFASERVSTDLAVVVDSVSRVCRSSFDRRIELVVRVADDAPQVDGNAGQLEQVLLNFCVNARDGLVDITGRTPRIEIDVGPAIVDGRDMALMQVRDNGIGIEPAVQARIFDPFFTTKEVGRGTGLGLSSVQGIVRGHGGRSPATAPPEKAQPLASI
jgi:signal transduction histidine kinase